MGRLSNQVAPKLSTANAKPIANVQRQQPKVPAAKKKVVFAPQQTNVNFNKQVTPEPKQTHVSHEQSGMTKKTLKPTTSLRIKPHPKTPLKILRTQQQKCISPLTPADGIENKTPGRKSSPQFAYFSPVSRNSAERSQIRVSMVRAAGGGGGAAKEITRNVFLKTGSQYWSEISGIVIWEDVGDHVHSPDLIMMNYQYVFGIVCIRSSRTAG